MKYCNIHRISASNVYSNSVIYLCRLKEGCNLIFFIELMPSFVIDFHRAITQGIDHQLCQPAALMGHKGSKESLLVAQCLYYPLIHQMLQIPLYDNLYFACTDCKAMFYGN